MPQPATATALPAQFVERRIYLIRGQKVMVDASLAELYSVPTSRLNAAVKRNRERFPQDFMFQLTPEEAETLISQNVISKREGRRTLPFVFTEHGVAMLYSVLNSPSAVQMNIFIVLSFIKLREILATHQELAAKMEPLEREQIEQGQQLAAICDTVRSLIETTEREPPPVRRIGFPSAL